LEDLYRILCEREAQLRSPGSRGCPLGAAEMDHARDVEHATAGDKRDRGMPSLSPRIAERALKHLLFIFDSIMALISFY